MAAIWGPNVLFCMQNRTKCILFVHRLSRAGRPASRFLCHRGSYPVYLICSIHPKKTRGALNRRARCRGCCAHKALTPSGGRLGQALQLVFYGDSIVESWRGTAHGAGCGRCRGIPEVWDRHFGIPYRAAAFGIATDQTAHLLWRVLRGRMPEWQGSRTDRLRTCCGSLLYGRMRRWQPDRQTRKRPAGAGCRRVVSEE
jgi:hypothetical protein